MIAKVSIDDGDPEFAQRLVNGVMQAYKDRNIDKKRGQVREAFKDLQVMRSKLEALEEERRQAELDAATGGKVDRGWGTQIRSYVIYDNRVKDHRTGHEVMNPQKVLDGAVGPFIDAELKRRRAERETQHA